MSRHDPRVTLRQIADYGRRVQQLCAGRDLPELLADWQATMAFERALEIIGEAVKRLPPELCATRPEIPWREIASTRNHLNHGYDALDYSILWDAATHDLGPLLSAVRDLLAALDASPPATD